jgi:hypothetical protein
MGAGGGDVRSLSALDQRVFAPMSRRAHERIIVALAVVLGVRLLTGSHRRFAHLPEAMWDPPWFLSWATSPPSESMLVAVQAMGLAAVLAVVLARGRAVAPFALAWAATLVLAGVETSAGKTLHNHVVLLLVCIPFLVPPRPPATTGRPADEADDGRDERGGPRASDHLVEGWHRRSAMTVVALAYLLAGVMKLRHSGLAWVTSDNLRWVLYSGARSPQSALPDVARWVADRAWLSTTIAAITLSSELLFPLALVVRRLRLVLAGAVVGLHVGVHLLLGLDYWSWVAVVVILFVPSALAGRLRSEAPGADGSPVGPHRSLPADGVRGAAPVSRAP